MLCAVCDSDPNYIIFDSVNATYSINIHENVCNRLMYDCYQYLIENKVAGEYLV